MLQGIVQALQVYKRASRHVTAYKKFLNEQGFPARRATDTSHFTLIPITNKKNYIHRFPLFERCPREYTPPILYASSGSSGVPTYWFSNEHQVRMATLLHEKILRNVWNIKKHEKTLVIVCFSMGVWIAGQHTRQAFFEIAKMGYRLTVISPGYAKEDVIALLKNVAPLYQNVILAGHPPFIVGVVQDACHCGIHFPRGRTFFLTAGDKASEEWRDAIYSLIGGGDITRMAVNVYGSTDAGMMAHETPLTVGIRRYMQKKKVHSNSLFGANQSLPGFFQYHPEYTYFESSGEELILTTDGAIPLIRYNICDIGYPVPHAKMISLLQGIPLPSTIRHALLKAPKLPFLIVRGRKDIAATFYALHIYPEHINTGLEDSAIARFVTGTYLSYTRSVRHGKGEEFHVDLELAKGVRVKHSVENALRSSLVKNLVRLNIEYRKLHEWIGTQALPKLRLHSFGDLSFTHRKENGFVRMIGKKARMIVS